MYVQSFPLSCRMKNTTSPWPRLDFNSLKDSLETLHHWVQIVGKIRLKTMPWQNHSWHTTLYVTPNGFSTQSIPFEGGAFQIDFDFIHHFLSVKSTHSKELKMDLYPRTVASFYKELFKLLDEIGLKVDIYAKPNEMEKAIPFAENELNKSYDKVEVRKFWEAMVKINCVFTSFRSEFIGKCSPIHLFWGAFDLAVTRFSGKKAPLHSGGMPNMPLKVMQEAYSHEVSSAGFWPGSSSFPEPAFYAYCYPTPDEFANQKVLPKETFYSADMGEFFLKYSDVAAAENPEEMLMQFLQSTYEAAANTLDWDREALER